MGHSLDDPAFVTRLDPKGMLGLTASFPEQCRKALALTDELALAAIDREPSNVILTGLGGSAAGGDFVRALFEAGGSVPFVVNRDYFLPSYAGPQSLVFVVSYSGNTEETLSAYADARKKGPRLPFRAGRGALRAARVAGRSAVSKGFCNPRTMLREVGRGRSL
jgi:glucose/mannose-6-phosphate isomerase